MDLYVIYRHILHVSISYIIMYMYMYDYTVWCLIYMYVSDTEMCNRDTEIKCKTKIEIIARVRE